jgi:hypothetical protein
MEQETKKRFPKEFSISETKNSLIKEPTGLNDIYAPLGIGLPDIYKKMEQERYSLPKTEDIQKRIDILKTQENVDHDIIQLLEEMKTASEIQIRADLDPMDEIKGYKSVHDVVKDEQDAVGKGIQQTLSKESIQLINKQIELDPGIFRSKYPELFDYVTKLKD